MTSDDFTQAVLQGIPEDLPPPPVLNNSVSHAPKRKSVLAREEKKLALKNALRYFKKEFHPVLAPEFRSELETYGHIYMYRFKPTYRIYARSIHEYPCRSKHAAAIMLMINNNLDAEVAQFPDELITYGGNGAVFQNWAQYLLTMKYLSAMSDEQTLILYSGHPLGLFPSHKEAPRVVVSNGMVIPNYSSRNDYERLNALGVSQYGQMTAGSFMYIGPQGIVHGTAITVLNAGRKKSGDYSSDLKGKIYVTSGLGGMSGAQAKATVIAGGICVVAEINPMAIEKRYKQAWVDEVYEDINKLTKRMTDARDSKEAVSIAYAGNVVDLWEKLARENYTIDLGSDQTSLHNPYSGGYYPVGLTLEESNKMMVNHPDHFMDKVRESLQRQVAAINILSERGMYFWDYGNAFLLESGRAGADIFTESGDYRYSSYVQDIMGPMFFDYGFGPFRWVCTSSDPADLKITDEIALKTLEEIAKTASPVISSQLKDNIHWIREAGNNNLVVGSQARILYADAAGRIRIAEEFNRAIKTGLVKAPIVLGRDHHDVSGTDSPFRETSDIYDGSSFTADMAIQNVIGDAFRGATWVSIHNGGGVGWGEAINGGFGLVLDGSEEAVSRLKSMLHWDVYNGISRRCWARNPGAIQTVVNEMKRTSGFEITIPEIPDEDLLNEVFP